MNVQEVIDTHLESGAEITVSTTPVNREAARSLGIMLGSGSGCPVCGKPVEDNVLDGLAVNNRQTLFLASMGIYVFNMNVLCSLLEQSDQTDFGKHIIPKRYILIGSLAMFLRATGKILVLFDLFGQLIWL